MIPSQYISVRQGVIDAGYENEIDWIENIAPPETAESFAFEYVWIVLNSGLKNQVAQGVWNRLQPVLEAGGQASEVFGHPGKCAAIDEVWAEREHYFAGFLATENLLEYCESLPFVGGITKYHLAKNLGANVAKPDRHLVRVADATGETVEELCTRLAEATGDRIATVDLVIWRACNLGIVTVEDGHLAIRL